MNARNLFSLQNILFAASVLFSLAVFVGLYNKFWYPPDDGAYVHVADRILSGQVLNKDIHDIHMGYINIVNAFALYVFGDNIASLRIPLGMMGLIQVAIIFRYFQPHGAMNAVMAAVLMTVFSFVLFANPTANWYGLFLTIILVVCLNWMPKDYKYRLAVIGFILGSMFLFRQLTGVIVAISAVSFILFQEHDEQANNKPILAKTIFLIMLTGLGGYLLAKINISGIILFGLMPLLLLFVGLVKIKVGDRKVLMIVGQLMLGGVIAFIPIVLYHLFHGSLGSWYEDTVLSALNLIAMPFIDEASFLDIILYSIGSLLSFSSVHVLPNAIFWIVVLLIPMIVGGRLLVALLQGEGVMTINPLPYVSVFYALVAVHYQIPIYLFYTLSLMLCGYLWSSLELKSRARNGGIVTLCGVILIAAFYQIGQPAVRAPEDILSGSGEIPKTAYMGGRVNLRLEEEQVKKYTYLKEIVDQHSKAQDSIFAFPSNSELYFITERSNPFRFFNSSFGVANQRQYIDVISVLENSPPKIIFYSPDDKYNTDYSIQLAEYVRENYTLHDTYKDLEVYIND